MKHTLALAALILSSCASGLPRESLVFEHGALQCEPVVTLEASAQKLKEAGVDVLKSSCGSQTGVGYAAVCAGRSGDLLVHEIRSVDLADAERLGFQKIELLVDADAGYQLTDCTGGS
jgi:hypothetical protein